MYRGRVARLETGIKAPNQGGWRRKHDDPHAAAYIPASRLRGRYYPRNLQELVEIVCEASTDSVPYVRACGSHWSLSEAVCDAGYTGRMIETHRLNRTLYHVIPACLSNEVRHDLFGQPMPGDSDWNEQLYTLYHVEAGICINELYLRLDGQDPRWPAPPAPGGAAHGPQRWALPTMAAAGGQTIAGAISTSTHGSDHRLPPMADMVQAVHLVGAGGRQFWIERARFCEHLSATMCDLHKLQRALMSDGGAVVEIIQDDDLLNAIIVSLGRMGIIYSVVLKVVQGYGLAETRYRSSWHRLRHAISDPHNELFSGRYAAIVVNPFPRARGRQHTCWVTQRQAIPLAAISDLLPRRHSPPPPDRPGDRRQSNRYTHPLLTAICASQVNIGRMVGGALNRLARHRQQRLIAHMIELFLAFEQGEALAAAPLRDISYALLDRHNYADHSCLTAGDALEVAFDAGGDLPVRFVEESIFVHTRRLLEGRLTGTPAIGATYVSIRFTAATRALLGIQRWPRTCLVAVAGLRCFAGLAPLLDALEADALELGGVVHWGQRNHLTHTQVARAFPELAVWRQALRRLSAYGPSDTFSTVYTRRAGLEP